MYHKLHKDEDHAKTFLGVANPEGPGGVVHDIADFAVGYGVSPGTD